MREKKKNQNYEEKKSELWIKARIMMGEKKSQFTKKKKVRKSQNSE